MSTHGFERRIAEMCPALSRGQVKKAAKKTAHLADKLQTVEDFERALRILGISSDPTALTAISNMEAAA